MVAYASADGGKTWEPTLEKKAEKGGLWYGDPAVAFGPDGAAYFAAHVLRQDWAWKSLPPATEAAPGVCPFVVKQTRGPSLPGRGLHQW